MAPRTPTIESAPQKNKQGMEAGTKKSQPFVAFLFLDTPAIADILSTHGCQVSPLTGPRVILQKTKKGKGKYEERGSGRSPPPVSQEKLISRVSEMEGFISYLRAYIRSHHGSTPH